MRYEANTKLHTRGVYSVQCIHCIHCIHCTRGIGVICVSVTVH